MSDETVGLREAAERLGVHYMTVYRHVRTGRLEAHLEGSEWRVPLEAVDRRLKARDEPAAATGARRRSTAQRRAELLDRMVAADEAGAWWVVEGALASGTQPAAVYLELLGPVLDEIGERWEQGELSVADEHCASAVALRLVGRLGPRFRPRGRRRGAVVVGAVAGDHHALPPAIVADLLRAEGLEVIELGADVPPTMFAEAAVATPRLVGVAISVTWSESSVQLAPTVSTIREAGVKAMVIAGGHGISSADVLAAGADEYSASARDVIDATLARLG